MIFTFTFICKKNGTCFPAGAGSGRLLRVAAFCQTFAGHLFQAVAGQSQG